MTKLFHCWNLQYLHTLKLHYLHDVQYLQLYGFFFIIMDQFTQFWVIGTPLYDIETWFWKSTFEFFIKFKTFFCILCATIKVVHIKMLFNFPSQSRIDIFIFICMCLYGPINRNWDDVTSKIALVNLCLIILSSCNFDTTKISNKLCVPRKSLSVNNLSECSQLILLDVHEI